MATKRDIDAAVKDIQSEYEEECLAARLGDIEARDVESLPTGILSLDTALGIGGLPKGRIVEIMGPNSNGKTAVLLHAIAETQKRGGQAAFVDAEQTFDPIWAAALGVDVDKLVYIQAQTAETYLETIKKLSEAKIDIIGVDSIEGLVPKAEVDGDMGQNHMGVKARLMSQGCRKLAGIVAASKTCAVFTNQLRMKIGVMFGNPETTPGGEAMKFWASVRIDVRRKEFIDEGDLKKVGIHVMAKIVKSKVGPPFREAEFDIYSGNCKCHRRGVDFNGDVFDLAERLGVVKKAGSWFVFGEEKIGQGRIRAVQTLASDQGIMDAIRTAISEASPIPGTPVEEVGE